MSKIKVLQVIGSLRVGGAETVAMNFFRYIDRERFEFDFIVYGEKVEPYEFEVKKLGGRVFHLNSPNEGYKIFLRELRRILREYGPYNIVHSHTLFNSGLVLKAAFMENVPLRIAHAHSSRSNVRYSWKKKIYTRLMRGYLRKYATNWIACSNQAGNYLFGENLFNKNGLILKNGIDISRYISNEGDRIKIRKKYKIEDKFVIGHIGRFSEVKNHEFIIDVFKDIYEKDTNSVLLLVGDGELRVRIEQKIQEFGLEKSVILTGTQNNVSQFLNAMDVFFFPSHYEGLGISVIEAQASGLYCIVSKAIPKEAYISNNIESLDLQEDKEIWTDKIIKNSSHESVIVPKDYDVIEQVRLLQQIYTGV